MNDGQANMTDTHLPRTASSNVVTSQMARTLLQAIKEARGTEFAIL